MKRWRYILAGLTLVFIVIQFIPTELPPTSNDNPGDIIKSGLVSQDVAILLKKSCYSCHSHETEYPWYSYVAPSSWLVAHDVHDAREELNFSKWQEYDTGKILSKLDDITSEVGEGRMPLGIYTIMHPTAKLDDSQRERIVAWAEATMDSVAAAEEDEEDDDDPEESQEN